MGQPTLSINGEATELNEVGRNVWRTDTLNIEGDVQIEASVEGHTLSDSDTFRVVKH